MQQQITNVHEMLTFQSRTVTTSAPNPQASELVEMLLPDIQRVSESWCLEQVRHVLEAELSKAVQACVSNMQQERKEDICHERGLAHDPVLPNFSGVVVRKRRQVGRCESRTSRTILGKLRCLATTYNVLQPSNTGNEENHQTSGSSPRKETQISFVFKPSKWLIKLGVSRVLQFERTKSFSRCWQTTLRTFNVRAVFSLVFLRLTSTADNT